MRLVHFYSTQKYLPSLFKIVSFFSIKKFQIYFRMESGKALQRLQEAERPKDLHRVNRYQEGHPRQ
jgi:hypothetical protein